MSSVRRVIDPASVLLGGAIVPALAHLKPYYFGQFMRSEVFISSSMSRPLHGYLSQSLEMHECCTVRQVRRQRHSNVTESTFETTCFLCVPTCHFIFALHNILP